MSYRFCHKEGFNEGTENHLSAALDEREAFLTLPYGIWWATAQPEDFILISFNEETLRAPFGRPEYFGHTYHTDISAVKIHGKIHKHLGNARGKVIMHTHQLYSTALACSTDG